MRSFCHVKFQEEHEMNIEFFLQEVKNEIFIYY